MFSNVFFTGIRFGFPFFGRVLRSVGRFTRGRRGGTPPPLPFPGRKAWKGGSGGKGFCAVPGRRTVSEAARGRWSPGPCRNRRIVMPSRTVRVPCPCRKAGCVREGGEGRSRQAYGVYLPSFHLSGSVSGSSRNRKAGICGLSFVFHKRLSSYLVQRSEYARTACFHPSPIRVGGAGPWTEETVRVSKIRLLVTLTVREEEEASREAALAGSCNPDGRDAGSRPSRSGRGPRRRVDLRGLTRWCLDKTRSRGECRRQRGAKSPWMPERGVRWIQGNEQAGTGCRKGVPPTSVTTAFPVRHRARGREEGRKRDAQPNVQGLKLREEGMECSRAPLGAGKPFRPADGQWPGKKKPRPRIAAGTGCNQLFLKKLSECGWGFCWLDYLFLCACLSR